MKNENNQNELFDPKKYEIKNESNKNPRKYQFEPKLLRPIRDQIVSKKTCLDDLLPIRHTARIIWDFVATIDHTIFESRIKSHIGGAGRPAIDPRILMTLWLYAYSEGIASGRKLNDLVLENDVYRWIAGDVSVNYHSIDDFRSKNAEQFDEVSAQLLGILQKEGFLKLKRVGVDGVKIKSKTKKTSFRKKEKLDKYIKEAKKHIKEIQKTNINEEAVNERKKAARERAARERVEKLVSAKDEFEKLQAGKKGSRKDDVKVSITEPEARNMRFGNHGGFAGAYNVQVASDLDSGVMVGHVPTQDHNDAGGLMHILPEIRKNMGRLPEELVTDAQYTNSNHLDYADKNGVTLYSSEYLQEDSMSKSSEGNKFLKKNSKLDRDSGKLTCPAGNVFNLTKRNDACYGTFSFKFKRKRRLCSQCPLKDKCCPDKKYEQRASFTFQTERTIKLFNEHKKRVGTEKAKKLFTLRFQSELVHAKMKQQHALDQLHVQGMKRVRAEVTLVMIIYNLLRYVSLSRSRGYG